MVENLFIQNFERNLLYILISVAIIHTFESPWLDYFFKKKKERIKTQ